jgi:hypothetical protein
MSGLYNIRSRYACRSHRTTFDCIRFILLEPYDGGLVSGWVLVMTALVLIAVQDNGDYVGIIIMLSLVAA